MPFDGYGNHMAGNLLVLDTTQTSTLPINEPAVPRDGELYWPRLILRIRPPKT